jgi:hypothetical protein
MDHFIGKTPLNMPFYFHKSFTKMCNRVQVEPDNIQSALCHFGLINIIIVEELRKRERTWEHFPFWGGFQLETQPNKGKKRSSKKSPTPQSSLKRRKTINLDLPEEPTSSSRVKKAKKKLIFKETIEKVSTQQTKKTNVLDLPYSDSDSKPNKGEVPTEKNIDLSMEKSPEEEMFTGYDEGETSSNKKSKKSQNIKELKGIIAQQEVLERVIKARYKTLSENFAETNATFENLALESIKEKKKKKKITKDYNSLWWLAKRLKRKIKKLKARIGTHLDLQVLAQVIVNLQGDSLKQSRRRLIFEVITFLANPRFSTA